MREKRRRKNEKDKVGKCDKALRSYCYVIGAEVNKTQRLQSHGDWGGGGGEKGKARGKFETLGRGGYPPKIQKPKNTERSGKKEKRKPQAKKSPVQNKGGEQSKRRGMSP